MNIWQRIRDRFRALFRKERLDREMDEEMRWHIELRTQQNLAAGMDAKEARYAALRQFGWVESIKESCREQRPFSWLADLGQDVRFGLRMLPRNPAVTAIAVLSLALGITLNATIFSLVDGIWLRSRSFADPSRVVRIFGSTPRSPQGDLSDADYQDLRAQMQSLADLAINERLGTTLVNEEGPVDLRADTVSRSFFTVLGSKPYLGRFFSETDAPDLRNMPSVVLSHRLWQRYFGGSTNLVGTAIRLSGQTPTVLGIAPADFNGLERLNPADVWYPVETQSVRACL